ncbi:MAG: M15 family metallopeptidase [Oscillospiraceae bacterium]|nr:M15 family metallopeptidase [Oscillospiraceae bacterium]
MKKTVLTIVLVLAIILAGAGAVWLIYDTFKMDPEEVLAAPVPEETPAPSPTPTPTPEPTPEPTPDHDWPDVDITSWEFLLANPDHSIGDYAPTLATLEGQQLDERIIQPMEDFVAAARAEGLKVYLSSGYRDYATQNYLYQRKVAQYGEETAKTIVAVPGTSEHQTGLACDITDQYYEFKDSSLENTALYQWMSQHCQEYGFIVRFPKGKEDITGIIYEPWHFRYVGVEAATYIMENGLCLEEFLELYEEA